MKRLPQKSLNSFIREKGARTEAFQNYLGFLYPRALLQRRLFGASILIVGMMVLSTLYGCTSITPQQPNH